MIGKQIAQYTISSRLGAGGMGEVYRARDGRLGRDVAVKILPEIFAHDISPDGKQFVAMLSTIEAEQQKQQAFITLRWFEDLKKRTATN